jgi:hypothetical protein
LASDRRIELVDLRGRVLGYNLASAGTSDGSALIL